MFLSPSNHLSGASFSLARAATLTLVTCLCLALGHRSLANEATPRAKLNQAVMESQVGKSLPLDLRLIDADERPVTLRDIVTDGQPTILCLVYFECPMLCKLTAKGLVRAVSSLENDQDESFNVTLVSFDPRDTPERAAATREQTRGRYPPEHDGINWFFLTGEQSAIDALTDAVGFHYAWDEETGQYAHPSGLVIIAPDGTITEYLDGVRFSPAELQAALKRAREGVVSEDSSTSFVRCYLYDPTTGKFGAAVQWTIRVLGVMTVFFVVAGISWLSHRESADISEAPGGD